MVFFLRVWEKSMDGNITRWKVTHCRYHPCLRHTSPDTRRPRPSPQHLRCDTKTSLFSMVPRWPWRGRQISPTPISRRHKDPSDRSVGGTSPSRLSDNRELDGPCDPQEPSHTSYFREKERSRTSCRRRRTGGPRVGFGRRRLG